MIPVLYFRSSSLNNWYYCQNQFFIGYVLGHEKKSTLKTTKGTAVHKVLELLAEIKRRFQQTTENSVYFHDEAIGDIKVDRQYWMDPYLLSNQEVDMINKSRQNKSNYLIPCQLPYGYIRYGVSLVNTLISRVIEYYDNTFDGVFKPVDIKDIDNWVWMDLEYKNGMMDPRKRKIVSPEIHFDFAIEHEWAQYEYETPKGKISGNLSLKGTIDLVVDEGNGILEIIDWKGLPVETKIPTINGWKTMGELVIGDIIFDKGGKPTKVLAKSRQKYKECYLIKFDDTSEVICDNEHLWLLDNNRVVASPLLKCGDKIDITSPLETNDTDLPIDPYVLGVWLGDGRNRCGEISNNDEFIVDEIKRRGYIVGNNINKTKGCPSYTIYNLSTSLRQLGLLHNKHIPDIYKRASYKQRLDLLRGLMDTDGNVNKIRKQTIFTNCTKKLSDDVKELLLTLGQRPLQSDINHAYKDGFVKVYPISFRPININPFLLPRKSNQISKEWGDGRSSKRTITNITKLNTKLKTQCISVDSPTKTYLCTENMIPTHNTGSLTDWNSKNCEDKTYKKICDDTQLMLYYYAAHKLFPEAKQIMVTIMFIRSGGPYTICFDDSHLKKIEDRIKDKFYEIRNTKVPAMVDPTQNSFKCTRICDYYKMAAPNGSNFCRFIHEKIKSDGIEKVVAEHSKRGFELGKYSAPGEIKE